MLWAIFFASIAVLYIVSAGGCDFGKAEVVKEVNETNYVRGQEELRRGNIQEAANAFLKVVEKRPDAPESHLELGRIYLSKMDNPIRAIYHFEKYLEYKPNSPSSPMVRQMIATAQKKFASSLPESPFENNFRRIELEDLLQKVQKENLDLKQKLSADSATIDRLESTQRVSVASRPSSQSRRAEASQPSQSQGRAVASDTAAPQVQRDTPSSYTVQPGDTLSSISRKTYGTPNRWRDIFNANRDRMSTPEALKPGQVLRVPK